MVDKIEQAVSSRGIEAFSLSKKLDDGIDKIEMQMEMMTPEKRRQAEIKVGLLKKQRDAMNGDVSQYRNKLQKMLKQFKKSAKHLENQAKKVKKTEKIVTKKNLSLSNVTKKGTDAVVAALINKQGTVIDTNPKKKSQDLSLKDIFIKATKNNTTTNTTNTTTIVKNPEEVISHVVEKEISKSIQPKHTSLPTTTQKKEELKQKQVKRIAHQLKKVEKKRNEKVEKKHEKKEDDINDLLRNE
ncbi:hypothetical protein QTN25_001409 [Entamoeba marina]